MDALAVPTDRGKGWYLFLMAPNTKGPTFAWLDQSRLYCNSQVLARCMIHFLHQFPSISIIKVAGVESMSFLSWFFSGSAVATTLGKGFLAICKAGHLSIQTQSQEYSDYSDREKMVEVRLDVLRPGLQVLILDQWIETRGTTKAAIKLVERQGATVVGVAAVAIEKSEEVTSPMTATVSTGSWLRSPT
ncbi:zgc:174895 [Oncorhynchus masou masou]|uniref:zgc:174895 n=1 Tax=Oncorhynchus masou masou TaxID=90313 RepID=UPI00318393E0